MKIILIVFTICIYKVTNIKEVQYEYKSTNIQSDFKSIA